MRTITKYRAPSERVGGERQQVSRPGRGKVLLKPPTGDTKGTAYSIEKKKGIVLPITDLCAEKKTKPSVPAEQAESSAAAASSSGTPRNPHNLEATDSEEDTAEDSGALLNRAEKRRREAGFNPSLTPQAKRSRSARPSPTQPRSYGPAPSTSAPAEGVRRSPPSSSPSGAQHPGADSRGIPRWSSRRDCVRMLVQYSTEGDVARAHYEVDQPDFPAKYLEVIHKKNMLDMSLSSENQHLKKALKTQEAQIVEHGFCPGRIRNLQNANGDLTRKLGHTRARVTELEKERAEARKLRLDLEKELAAEKKTTAARQAEVAALNEQLTALNAELAARRSDPSLLVEKEALLNKKEIVSAAVSTSQNSGDLLREQISNLQARVAELEVQQAVYESTISDLRRSHLKFLRDWVKSQDYEDAFTYSAQTDYIMGYAEARQAIFAALKELGLADRLNIGKFRSYENERMYTDGRTLKRPIEKRPTINLPGIPVEEREYDEWEKPYPSAQPVEGELMDLDRSVYEELEAQYAYYLGTADQAQVVNPGETSAEQLAPDQVVQDAPAQGGESKE